MTGTNKRFDRKRFEGNLSFGYDSVSRALRDIARGRNIQMIENAVWHAVDSRSCALYDAQLEGAPANCLLRISLFDGLLDILRNSLSYYSLEDADETEIASYQEAMAELSNYGRELRFEATKNTLEKIY